MIEDKVQLAIPSVNFGKLPGNGGDSNRDVESIFGGESRVRPLSEVASRDSLGDIVGLVIEDKGRLVDRVQTHSDHCQYCQDGPD